jgi:cyanophycin synthetase
MRIEGVRDIPGPNVYSHDPVLVMTLDLQDLAEKESYEIDGFTDRLLAILPGVQEHYCGLGRPGGFLERLRSGTWFGHIVEHVALELTDALGISVNRGKTVSAGEPGKFLVAVTYKSQPGMRFLLTVAVELVQALVDDKPYPLADRLEEGRRIVAEDAFGPSTQAIVSAAKRRKIPYERLEDSLVRLGYGRQGRFIQATVGAQTSAVAVEIACNKQLTRQLLEKAALPTPAGQLVQSCEAAMEVAQKLGGLVVVKPLDGNQGKGVSLNLSLPLDIADAYEIARRYSSSVVVERLARGRDYRVLVVNGRFVAASEKTPAHVVGDGQHTIGQLVEIANSDPRRGENHSRPLSKISRDAIVDAFLARSGITFETIPPPGAVVVLRESANLSTGGEARDVTDEVHPEIARMCERAARVIGLDICGIDLVVPGISQPWSGEGGIVEINAAPGIRMHENPVSGQPRDVGSSIVDMLFPSGSNGRIPIISITGTNGKTTTTRMVGHVLCRTGSIVGMTTTDGIWIDCKEVARGDMTGPWSARVVLHDPAVDIAVLETARGGIVRSGLGYDWSDIAVLTNVQPDHIGQDGIETVDDVLRIKALVAERVREGGTLVLNADDERLCRLPEHPRISRIPRQVVFFSLQANNLAVTNHLASGGTAYLLKGDWIEEHHGEVSRRLVRASEIPCTFHGTAEFQISNVMACIAACRAAGTSIEVIVPALMAFHNGSQNDGRVNMYRYRDAVVVLDYAHNTHAIDAISRMVRRWRLNHSRAVIGLPGDRTDALLTDTSKAAARGFDSIVIREDLDLRGRRPGEMAALIRSAVLEELHESTVEVVIDELDAVSRALNLASPGEAIVCFCDRKQEVTDLILARGALPSDDQIWIHDLVDARRTIPA